MFAYSQKDLNTIDPILEPLFARAKDHAAQTEQLAMDATRLMSVRPDQFEMSAKQPFFKRLAANFNGQNTANINNLYEMQRIGWRYIQILNERDLMMAHSMITVKNNLLTLAVTEKETRELMTTMANKIADRFEILEEKYRDMAVTQEIHGWLLTFGTRNYHKQPEKLRLLQIVREAFLKKQTAWNFAELPYLHQALINAGLEWEKEITLADFIDDLIDEIEAKGFHVYDQLIALNDANGRIEQKFILENISAPSHKSLYKIADNYDASSDMIDLLADQLSISKKDAMKKVLRGFIEKEGIDTSIKIPMRDLAVELLGCHGLVLGLWFAPVPTEKPSIPYPVTPKSPSTAPSTKSTPSIESKRIGKFIIRDGIATDTLTGLTWLRFDLGQTWNQGACQGNSKGYNWEVMFKEADKFNENGGYDGFTDWKVPTIDELKTLIDKKGQVNFFSENIPFIDQKVFPKESITQRPGYDARFWSSSLTEDNDGRYLNFSNGKAELNHKAKCFAVRLVCRS